MEKCSICQNSVHGDDDIMVCPGCRTYYHLDCWFYIGNRCANPKCSMNAVSRTAPFNSYSSGSNGVRLSAQTQNPSYTWWILALVFIAAISFLLMSIFVVSNAISGPMIPTPTDTKNNSTWSGGNESPTLPPIETEYIPPTEEPQWKSPTEEPQWKSSTDVPADHTNPPATFDWSSCHAAYSTRLKIGVQAYVSEYPPKANWLRSVPYTDAKIIGRIEPLEKVTILDGPSCSGGYIWWKVNVHKDGNVGWTAEGDTDGSYWLVPNN